MEAAITPYRQWVAWPETSWYRTALQTAGWKVVKRFLEFLYVPVLDGAGVGVGNLDERLRFEVKVNFFKLQI